MTQARWRSGAAADRARPRDDVAQWSRSARPREDSIGQPLKEGDRLPRDPRVLRPVSRIMPRAAHANALPQEEAVHAANCERFPYSVGGLRSTATCSYPGARAHPGRCLTASPRRRAPAPCAPSFTPSTGSRIEPHQRVVIQAQARSTSRGGGGEPRVSELIVVGAPERTGSGEALGRVRCRRSRSFRTGGAPA
mgnify:CR=1 FL=1